MIWVSDWLERWRADKWYAENRRILARLMIEEQSKAMKAVETQYWNNRREQTIEMAGQELNKYGALSSKPGAKLPYNPYPSFTRPRN